MGKTVFTELRDVCARAPEAPAIIFRGQCVPRGQFLRRVKAFAGWLEDQPGGPVAISMADGSDLLVAFFAAAALGRPAMVLDKQMSDTDRKDVLVRSGAGTVIDAALPQRHDHVAWPDVSGDAEFYFGLTSGTTGRAKIFARTHRSWLATFDAAQRVFDFQCDDRVAIIGSLSHSLFLYGAVHALCAGLSVILCAPYLPGRALREITAHGATVVYGVPAMLEPLAKGLRAAPGMRLIISGGARLGVSQRIALEQAAPGARVIETYGASELSYVAHAHGASDGSDTVGKVFPGVEVEIRSSEGEVLPAGASGLVWVRSPMLFSRYLGEDVGCPAAQGGWASVGDVGVLDESGALLIRGRADRTMNTKGLKIRPEPVEDVLVSHDDVVQAVVLGLCDERRGERIAAVIIAREGCTLSRAQLIEFCRQKVGARAAPQRFFRALRLPMTRSGKVAIARLRDALSRGDPGFMEMQ